MFNKKKQQTIIRYGAGQKGSSGYDAYPFEALSEDFRNRLSKGVNENVIGRRAADCTVIPYLLECFLQVTGRKLDLYAIRQEAFFETYGLFVGAINSNKFNSYTVERRYVVTCLFQRLMEYLQEKEECIALPYVQVKSKETSADIVPWVTAFEKLPCDDEKVWLWQGWPTINKSGRVLNLPLYPIYQRLGREFTTRFHEVCDQYYRTRRASRISGLRLFAEFLGSYPGTVSSALLCESKFMTRFWREFFAYYIRTSHEQNVRMSTCVRAWRSGWAQFATEYLIPSRMFAAPWGAFPSPEPKYLLSANTHLQVSKEGHEIKTKLLTHIPLHLSDDNVMKLLFEEIQREHDCVVEWATWAAKDLWAHYENRLKLSHDTSSKWIGVNSKIDFLNEENPLVSAPALLRTAAANCEHLGFLSSRDSELDHRFPKPLSRTARALGLPVTDSLFPHCLILVANHPMITAAFLEQLELFNKDGAQIGFVETDAGSQLIGIKRRCGANRSQQIVHLTDVTAQIVRQIIALTKPLREYLKNHNDPAWRLLLLTCGQGFMYPKGVSRLATCTDQRLRREALAVSFGNTSKLSLEERRELLSRLSISSLRASAGVLVYLKTKSAAKMAAALGHAGYDPRLLARYLPEPILSFFQERWVRIFQTGLIVEALKESPYALEASGFTSIDEMHEFLSRHALKLLPASLSESEHNEEGGRDGSEVVFGVNTAILTALVSLQLAVDEATTPVCAKATYWSTLSRHLVKHIETALPHRGDLQSYLRSARLKANSETMRALLHA